MKTKPKPNDVDAVIGTNLRLIRKTRGLSQVELAEALDITFQQVQKYEQGKNRVSASRLYDAAKVLDCNLMNFYDGLYDDEGAQHHRRSANLNRVDRITMQIVGLLNSIEDQDVKKKLLLFLKSLSLRNKS
ncbi:MAG: helix-turn-helix transcriptional regulator [Rhodospirillales bacterium]|nr:helix-turn-helix transcriptional regulator [Alphaproteobacteria bacterium]MCB1840611.1 helix-turn-helix transcriptional regulator [Alphaproteobacteria bacterium]MCB9977815.1 helix-turn-helix transcriptional regulator [Rhodospirillales bacterium]